MEREITALKKSLNNAIGDWTDDKQIDWYVLHMHPGFCSHSRTHA